MRAKRRVIEIVVVAAVLALASTAVPARSAEPGGDVVVEELRGVLFLRGEDAFGRIDLMPYDDPELRVVAGPADRSAGRTVAVVEAQASDGTGTGVWMASGSDAFPGSISVYVDGSTRVFVNEGGLTVRDAHRLAFGDDEHYLARCRKHDLCWYSPRGRVILTR